MKKLEYLLLIFIVGLAFAARLYKINNPVADWHSWRQADTASVTRIYVEQGIDLLRPRYHDISNIASGFDNPEGWRFVEFPVYNALHALLYKAYPVFGLDKWGRLTSVLCSLVSIVFIFLLGRQVISKNVGLLAAFFFAVLPFNVYFSRVILPEPMAVMFTVASLWFFARFMDFEKWWDVVIAGVFFSLAIMVKPYIVFYGVGILYLAIAKYGIAKLLTNVWMWIFFGISVTPFFFWRAWMWNNYYFVGIPHWKWAFNGDNIRFKGAFWWWILEERLGRMILGVWGTLLFVAGLVSRRKGKYPYFVHSLLVGQLAYVSLIATASVRHDYYQTLIIPTVSLALGVGTVALWNTKEWNKQLTRLAVTACIALSLFFSFYLMREDYKINHPEIITAGTAVDKLLPKGAIVIAPYDGDTAFLYQTKRKGFPYIIYPLPEMIKRLGAKYYVSVNFDAQTNQVMNEYKIMEKTDKYVIVDLTHKK